MRAFQFMGLLLIFQWCKQMGLFGSQENRKFYIVISDPFFQQMRIEGLLWFLSCGVFWNLIYLLIWILKQINNKCRERVCFMVLTWSLILWALVGMTVMLMLLSSVDESRDRAFFFFIPIIPIFGVFSLWSNFVTYIYTVKVEVPCCFFFLCVSFSLLGWLSLHFVLGILLNCGATASYWFLSILINLRSKKVETSGCRTNEWVGVLQHLWNLILSSPNVIGYQSLWGSQSTNNWGATSIWFYPFTKCTQFSKRLVGDDKGMDAMWIHWKVGEACFYLI